MEDASSSSSSSQYLDIMQTINAIKENNVSQDQLILLAQALGRSQSKETYTHSKAQQHQHDSSEFLSSYTPQEWISQQNPILTTFLIALTSTEDTDHHRKLNSLAIAIENIYLTRNLNFIGPLSFAINLLSYHITGSKAACALSSSISPCGSYTSVRNWISSHASSSISPPPSSDIIIFFDNNQIVSRNWRVRKDAKAKLSIITMVMHMITMNSHIQSNPHLSPLQWFDHGATTCQDSIKKVDAQDEALGSIFRHHQNRFLEEQLNSVYQEQKVDGETISDAVDHEPNHTNPSNTSEDPYSFIEEHHSPDPVTVRIGNPVAVNPNSYASVRRVLQAISEEAGIGTTRSWTVVGCDGQPYLIASRLQDSSFTCPHCKCHISSTISMKKHLSRSHQDTQTSSSSCKTFGSLLIIPGPGHVEMNTVRGLFKILWTVIIQRLAKSVLGFRTERALYYCRTASNHHKSWQIIQIILFGTIKEVLIPYVRQCISSKRHPSVEGLHSWMTTVADPNFKYIFDVLTTFAYPLHLYRAGIRRNNTDVASAARMMFSPLYYGTHMLNYQEIEARDRIMRAQLPPEVANYLKEKEIISASGHVSKGEGGDFILEAKNRKVKMWMPGGTPDMNHWLRVCRNIDRLDGMHQHLTTALHLPNDNRDDYIYHTDLQREIFAWRQELRRSGYLLSPLSSKPHISMDGVPLDDNLVHLTTSCRNNLDCYRAHVAAHGFEKKRCHLSTIQITKTNDNN